MNFRHRTYGFYAVGVAVVWLIVLVIVTVSGPASRAHLVYIFCAGFFFGWLSATIARLIYPPPKRAWHQTNKTPDVTS